jgi:hypothetical protein
MVVMLSSVRLPFGALSNVRTRKRSRIELSLLVHHGTKNRYSAVFPLLRI